jgi:hypothetical protein
VVDAFCNSVKMPDLFNEQDSGFWGIATPPTISW